MRRFYVRRSAIHGRGVFASAVMARGDYLLEYKGEVLSEREANRRFARSEAEAGHTFFFGIGDGRVIDGAVAGNSARWINHSGAHRTAKPSRTTIASISVRSKRSKLATKFSSIIVWMLEADPAKR